MKTYTSRTMRSVPAFAFATAWLLSSAFSAQAATVDQFALMQAQLLVARAELQQIQLVHPSGEVLGASISAMPSLAALKAQLAEIDIKIGTLQTQRAAIVAQITKAQLNAASSSAPVTITVNPGSIRNALLTAASNSSNHDNVTYSMSVDVMALDHNVYIAKNPAKSLLYELDNIAGISVGKTLTTVKSFTATAKLNAGGNYYVIPKGSSATFTMEVVWAPGSASSARSFQLLGLKYAGMAGATTTTWNATPIRSYRTDAVSTNM